MKKSIPALGTILGVIAIVVGGLGAGKHVVLPSFNQLPANLNFLYFLPQSDLVPGLTMIVVGLLLVSLFSSAICVDRCPSDHSRAGLPRGQWFISRVRLVIFSLSLLSYFIFLFLIIANGYSHYLLMPFLISLIGIAVSLKRGSLESEEHRIPLLDIVDYALLFLIAGFCMVLSSLDLLSLVCRPLEMNMRSIRWLRKLQRIQLTMSLAIPAFTANSPLGDSYFTAIFIMMFGPSVWAWKFSCVVVHAATAVLVYILGKILYGRCAGLSTQRSWLVAITLLPLTISDTTIHTCALQALPQCCFSSFRITDHLRSFLFLTGAAGGLLTYSIWGGLVTLFILGSVLALLYFKEKEFRVAIESSATVAFGFL